MSLVLCCKKAGYNGSPSPAAKQKESLKRLRQKNLGLPATAPQPPRSDICEPSRCPQTGEVTYRGDPSAWL